MALSDLRTPLDTDRPDIDRSGIDCSDIDCSALPVKGAVPPELDGTLFRIGPEAGHPYVSALRLRHGHAEWFRARRIRTDDVCRQTGELPTPGPRRCPTDNTAAAIIRHNRRTLALGDAALPYELSPTLRTKARWDFDGTLPAAFTSQAAHDPLTGELIAAVATPRTLDYVVVDVQGTVRKYEPIPTPHNPAQYSFALTDRHAVFSGPDGVGIMPREGHAADVTWIGTSGPTDRPLNAFDLPNGGIAIDTVGTTKTTPGLWRWHIEPEAGIRPECLNPRAQDLAVIDERYRGTTHRYTLTRRLDATSPTGTALLRHDLTTGTTHQHTAEPGRQLGAPVFVPHSPTAPEGQGWILVATHDTTQHRDQIAIIDTADFTAPPIAAIELPTEQREASACWQVADPW